MPSAKVLKRQLGQLGPEKSWMWGWGALPNIRASWVHLAPWGPTLILSFSTPRGMPDLLALQEVLVLVVLR